MEIGEWTAAREWTSTPELNRIYRDIRALGLESNLAELEAFGFTVIRDALDPELTVKLREAVLRSAETSFKKKLDLEKETELHEYKLAPYLLYKDPLFEKALLNPKPLAIISYLLGYSCWLSSLTSHVKGPGEVGLLLHSDTGNGVPAPFSPYSHVANCNYALTDYTEEGGALAMVPGSHRYFRQPTAMENKLVGNERNPHVIPVEVPAGTAIIWHGNQWHGSFPRKMPGLRVNLSMYFCRQYMAPQEVYGDAVPEDLLKRYGRDSRMAQLLGLNSFNGWKDEGPKMSARAAMPAGQTWQS
ncbi:MAG: phytanoyl-CoA dioxygenase family protein [Rhizomicrobium sp.]